MSCEGHSKIAARRYRRAMAIAAVLYIGVVALGVFVLDRFETPRWVAIALALAPLAPAALMVRAYLEFFTSMDEFQRRVQTDALLMTMCVVGLGAFTYGFLEEWAGFSHVPLIWVFPAMIITWVFAQVAVRMRYK